MWPLVLAILLAGAPPPPPKTKIDKALLAARQEAFKRAQQEAVHDMLLEQERRLHGNHRGEIERLLAVAIATGNKELAVAVARCDSKEDKRHKLAVAELDRMIH